MPFWNFIQNKTDPNAAELRIDGDIVMDDDFWALFFGGSAVTPRGFMAELEKYAGKDITVRDREKRTLLINAAIEGAADIVGLLISRGADLNGQDNDGKSALHFAAREKQSAVLDQLIKAGAKVDIQDQDGNTPLSDAVFEAREDGSMIEKLLTAGADPKLRNRHGVSPLELAESIDNYDLLKYFKRSSAKK